MFGIRRDTAGRHHLEVSPARRWHRRLCLVALLGVVAGCRDVSPRRSTAEPPTSAASTPASAHGSAATRLVLWAVPPFASPAESSARDALDARLEAFREKHPETAVDVVVRADRGAAAVEAMLIAVARVAPDRVPDVVMLPLDALSDTLALGIVAEMPPAVHDSRTDALFPCAAHAIPRGDTQLAVLPFAINALHLVARGDAIPERWPDVGREGALALPGDAGADAISLLGAWQASAGGDATVSSVDAVAALDTLRFVADGVRRGEMLAADARDGLRGTWNALLTNDAVASAVVPAGVFVAHQAAFPALAWAGLPGRDATAPVRAWGWAWAITASDPARRAAAGTLLDWFTAPTERDWVLDVGYLPAWSDSWAGDLGGLDSPPEAAYSAFVAEILARAETADASMSRSTDWATAYATLVAGGDPAAAATLLAPP